MEYIKYCHGKWVNKYGNQYDQVIDKNEVMKSLEAETLKQKQYFKNAILQMNMMILSMKKVIIIKRC